MSAVFIRQTALATADRVVSASSEAGLTTGQPEPATSNIGALGLKASGVPLTAHALDLALQRGGLPAGPRLWGSAAEQPPPGAALRWRLDGEPASQWRGHTSYGFLSYARTIAAATVVTDYPHASEPRTLPNGSVGYLRVTDGVADSLQFLHKATRTASWTVVATGATDVDPTCKPAFVVLPNETLVLYYIDTAALVNARYSTDNGATWSTYAADVGITGANKGLYAEVSGEHVCIVTAGTSASVSTDVKVYWSLDGGQSFAQTDSEAATCASTCVDSTGRVLVALSSGTDVNLYPIAVGGGLGAAKAMDPSVVAANPVFGLCAMDDGAILYWAEATTYPAALIFASMSTDNAATFFPLRGGAVGADEVFDNKMSGGPYGFASVMSGTWNGSMVWITTSASATAAQNNTLNELHFGGYDSLTETPKVSSSKTTLSHFYGGDSDDIGGVYIAHDTPEATGAWAKLNFGAGAATVNITDDGLNIVGSTGGNSRWTSSTFFQDADVSAGDAARVRIVFRINSGGSVSADAAYVGIAIGDGVDRQWVHVRLSADQLAVADESGTVASSASVADQFNAFTELLLVFAHETSAGEGTASVWYRIAGSDHWTAICTNQSIAEQAGNSDEFIRFGGTDPSDVDWDVAMVAVGYGAGGLADGFTNPDDLAGRGLSSSAPFHVYQGTRISAFGPAGVAGDTYTYETGYHFAARNVWLNSRPACHVRSSADGATWNAVFGDADNQLRATSAVLLNTNVPEIVLQMAATDSWASPTFQTTLSAVIWSGKASDSVKGSLKVDGEPFLPHQYQSRRGRRYWVEIGAAPGVIAEILDNDTDRLYVEDIGAIYTGSALRIFGDRMGATFQSAGDFYARLLVNAAWQVPDDHFLVGDFYLNRAHEVSIPYDTGHVDRWVPNIEVYGGAGGAETSAVLGPSKHELRIAWAPVDRMSSDYLERVVSLFKALQGEHEPIVFWRDTSRPDTIGLYRVQGPVSRENVYGEGGALDDFARLAQLVLREVTW